MTKHISFPSIVQYRDVIRRVKDQCKYHNISLPTLKFKGTTKAHGTNSGVIFKNGEMHVQSRENIITVLKDNAGFASYVHKTTLEKTENIWKQLVSNVNYEENDFVCIYGEYCGGSIQKGVALNQLSKRFIMFAVRIYNEETNKNIWLNNDELNTLFNKIDSVHKDLDFYCSSQFKTFELTIDMNNPQEYQNSLVEITNEVEQMCPIGEYFGVTTGETVGEGVVWKCETKLPEFDTSDLVFKVKGELHSATKVKTLAAVDTERFNQIDTMVSSFVTENRLNQGFDLLLNDGEVTISKTGDFLKWMSTDILKEELDTIVLNGFTPKDVSGFICKKSKEWFINKLNQQI